MKIARLPNGQPEVFRTLQGEGPSLGSPAVFVRLSLCNLHCVWCDTPFTWNWKGSPWPHNDDKKYDRAEQIIDLAPAEILPLIEETGRSGDRLVITGGEPLLQQSALIEMLPALPGIFSAVEVETNGTQLPSPELDAFVTQYNVSPKLANSGNADDLRLPPKALTFFAHSEKAFFKFVVQNKRDLEEVVALASRFAIPQGRILLMPEGRSPAELAKNRTWIAAACLQQGYRLTDRLHVQLWGDERGR